MKYNVPGSNPGWSMDSIVKKQNKTLPICFLYSFTLPGDLSCYEHHIVRCDMRSRVLVYFEGIM